MPIYKVGDLVECYESITVNRLEPGELVSIREEYRPTGLISEDDAAGIVLRVAHHGERLIADVLFSSRTLSISLPTYWLNRHINN